MNNKIAFVLFVIYWPIFIRLTSIGTYHYRIGTYGILILFIIYTLSSLRKNRPQSSLFFPFILFNMLFIIINIFQLFIHDNFYNNIDLITRYLFPFFLALSLLLFLSNYESYHLKYFLEKLFFFIGLVFVLQLLLSIYASYSGIPLVEAEKIWMLDPNEMLQQAFERRSMLSLIGVNLEFKFPLTMLLGGPNSSASLLAIYNLIFLYMFYKKRRKVFAVLVLLVLVAAILNTTRAAIGTILLCDMLFYIIVLRKKTVMSFIIRITLIVSVIYFLFLFAGNLATYFSKSPTYLSKLAFYSTYVEYIHSNFDKAILGHGHTSAGALAAELRSKSGYSGQSFESGFFAMLFVNGIFVFLYFIYFIYYIYYRSSKISPSNKIFGLLIVLSIIGTFMTTGGLIKSHTYQFLTLIYIYNLIQDASPLSKKNLIQPQ